MPFLFVDYDQGAGGEYFCRVLSETPQANKLEFITTDRGRTKIVDKFNQSFLGWTTEKPKLSSDAVLYDIVPTHRQVPIAKNLLDNVRSIRIANPVDPHLRSYLKYNQKNKVLLNKINFNDPYFLGEIKYWIKDSGTDAWVKNINKTHDMLDIILLSKGRETTQEERLKYIRFEFTSFLPEPDSEWDLIIPYEALFFDTDWVVEQIKNIFGIELNKQLLSHYYQGYVTYTFNTSS